VRSRSYLGTTFEVWHGNESWFWVVLDPLRNRGAIGVAATENDAVRDACTMIDETAPSAPPMSRLPPSRSFSPRTWETLLARLDRYLTRLCNAST
jgi:hypothetical protein